MFALTALTALLLLNFIARQLGELIGKGLPWSAIGEFVLLSVPFTVALTVPMSVLVSVLYAYSRLAEENAVTALKAAGVSPLRLVGPTIVVGLFMSIGLLAFNDQVLPRANHRLKTLQEDISQTKPTFLLKEQVINAIAEGKFYLKAGKIDRDSGRMWEVVIYNLTDPARRRTIYADSGRIAFAANMVDINMELFSGQMLEVATDKPSQLDRLFFNQNRIRVPNVGRGFQKSETDSLSRGDREMSICEMQRRLWQADGLYRSAQREYAQVLKTPNAGNPLFEVPTMTSPEPRGIGWAYCHLLRAVGGAAAVREAQAMEPGEPWAGQSRAGQSQARDTVAKKGADTVTQKADTAKKLADTTASTEPGKVPAPAPLAVPLAAPLAAQNPTPVPQPVVTADPAATAAATAAAAAATEAAATQALIAAQAAAEIMRTNSGANANAVVSPAEENTTTAAVFVARTAEAKLRLDQVARSRHRYDIEIHKKFSLAAACLIFVIVAAPIAVRFPRGGVGLVIGVSLVVFALYYVGLIGGESLANKGIVPPFWAMWFTNVIMTLVGIVLLVRMGHDSGSGRGGGIRERIDNWRARREDRALRSTT